MIGCASCLCASKTQQHFASWRDAVSPRHRPSTTGLRASAYASVRELLRHLLELLLITLPILPLLRSACALT